MTSEYTLLHRVTFGETDMGGVLHFSNYFKLMELAEHAFLRSLDIPYFDKAADVMGVWPRFHIDMQYLGAVMYDAELEINLLVTQKTHRSLTYYFLFRDPGAARPKSRGKMTVVYAQMDPTTGQMKPMPIPTAYLDKIGVVAKDRIEALGG